MSQRCSGYDRKPRDFYATPAWVTHALARHIPADTKIWEPACGDGAMANALRGATDAEVIESDIQPADSDTHRLDFFQATVAPIGVGCIVTNPPFGPLAQQFIEHALQLMKTRRGFIAMLLRCDFDHAKTRRHLFGDCPQFAKKIALTRRIVWFVEENGKPKAAPSYNHAWFIWDWQHKGAPKMDWAPVEGSIAA